MSDNNIFKWNSCSEDFPLKTKYGNIMKFGILSPVYHRKISPILYEYSNEIPDMFKLDIMKKGKLKYNNPHLNDVIKVDRSEGFKNIEKSGKIIKMLDKIKRNFKLNRDNSFLKKIKSEKAFEMSLMYKSKSSNDILKRNPTNNGLTLNYDNNKNNINFGKTFFSLYDNHIRRNNNIHLSNKLNKQIDKNYITFFAGNSGLKCSSLDKEKLETIKSTINLKNTSYLKNLNTFDIKESYNENKRIKFEFKRKPYIIYNPISNTYRKVIPDILTNNKWDSYSETFSLLRGNFGIKRGYFSEFSEMNKASIKMYDSYIKKSNNEKKGKKLKIPSPLKKI